MMICMKHDLRRRISKWSNIFVITLISSIFQIGCSAAYVLDSESNNTSIQNADYGHSTGDRYESAPNEGNSEGGIAADSPSFVDQDSDSTGSQDDDENYADDDYYASPENDVQNEDAPNAEESDFNEVNGGQDASPEAGLDTEDEAERSFVSFSDFGCTLNADVCPTCSSDNETFEICAEAEEATCLDFVDAQNQPCTQCFSGSGVIVFNSCLKTDEAAQDLVSVEVNSELLNPYDTPCTAQIDDDGRLANLTCRSELNLYTTMTRDGRSCDVLLLDSGEQQLDCHPLANVQPTRCERFAENGLTCHQCVINGQAIVSCFEDPDQNTTSTHLLEVGVRRPIPFNSGDSQFNSTAQCERTLSSRGELCITCRDSYGMLMVESCALQNLNETCRVEEVDGEQCEVCIAQDGLPTRVSCASQCDVSLQANEVCLTCGADEQCLSF